MHKEDQMRTVIRTKIPRWALSTAAVGCALSAAACTSSPRVGLHSLGWADTGKPPTQISATRSVAVAFSPAHDGQISAVNVVASRVNGPVGLLAYVVTENDPATGAPAKPVAAADGSEPGCWGSLTDSALSPSPSAVTILGTACPIRAGHHYWIQLSTVADAANLYARRGNFAGRVLIQKAPGGSWTATNVTGGLEVSPVTRADVS
jgi:hypothetical protein